MKLSAETIDREYGAFRPSCRQWWLCFYMGPNFRCFHDHDEDEESGTGPDAEAWYGFAFGPFALPPLAVPLQEASQ